MVLSKFFKKAGTRRIVINSDVDGFLCGMILQKYYGCEVVGFSNSKESIWLTPDLASLPDAEALRAPIYIDIFVNDRYVYSIDQHIIASSNDHAEALLEWDTKMNPNIDVSRRTYSGDLGNKADYYHKYPFGTVHYLIALMKKDGVDVRVNDLGAKYMINGADSKRYEVTPGHLILRADDALYSSLGPYKENATEWWSILSRFDSQTIQGLTDYLDNCDEKKNGEYKEYIGKIFRRGLGCDGIDGSFDTTTDSSGFLQKRIVRYNEILNEVIGIKMMLPNELVEYRGISRLGKLTAANMARAFTYAFVAGPTKSNYFSYTTKMKKIT